MVCSARTQPIIVNATADMMKEHFLPVARKLREQSLNMRKEEEEFHAETRRLQHRKEGGEVESEIQEVRTTPSVLPFFLSQSGKNRKKWRPYIAAAKFNLNLTLICCSNYIINIISRKHTKYCRKLTCFNIIYARRNYFTSHSSCDIAVTWQPKQPCHFSVSLNSVKDAYYELMVRTVSSVKLKYRYIWTLYVHLCN